MTKKKNKKPLGEIEEDLLNQVKEYVKLVNKHAPKGSKISVIGLIRNYFNELLSKKVLNNDFINIDEPFYYNLTELLKNSEVIASTEKPISAPEEQVKVYRIPNNLDTFNKKYNTFCYEENSSAQYSTKHKGIQLTIFHNYPKDSIDIYYLIYDYDQFKHDGNYHYYPELKIGLVKPEFLEVLLDRPEDKLIITKLRNIEKNVHSDIENHMPPSKILIKYNDRNTFSMLFHEAGMKKATNITSEIFNKLLNIELEYTQQVSRIIKEAEEIGLDNISDEKLEHYNIELFELFDNRKTKIEKLFEEYSKYFPNIPKEDLEKKFDEIKEKTGFNSELLSNMLKSMKNNEMPDFIKISENLKKDLSQINDEPYNFLNSVFDSTEGGPTMKKMINTLLDSENEEEFIENFKKEFNITDK